MMKKIRKFVIVLFFVLLVSFIFGKCEQFGEAPNLYVLCPDYSFLCSVAVGYTSFPALYIDADSSIGHIKSYFICSYRAIQELGLKYRRLMIYLHYKDQKNNKEMVYSIYVPPTNYYTDIIKVYNEPVVMLKIQLPYDMLKEKELYKFVIKVDDKSFIWNRKAINNINKFVGKILQDWGY